MRIPTPRFVVEPGFVLSAPGRGSFFAIGGRLLVGTKVGCAGDGPTRRAALSGTLAWTATEG